MMILNLGDGFNMTTNLYRNIILSGIKWIGIAPNICY